MIRAVVVSNFYKLSYNTHFSVQRCGNKTFPNGTKFRCFFSFLMLYSHMLFPTYKTYSYYAQLLFCLDNIESVFKFPPQGLSLTVPTFKCLQANMLTMNAMVDLHRKSQTPHFIMNKVEYSNEISKQFTQIWLYLQVGLLLAHCTFHLDSIRINRNRNIGAPRYGARTCRLLYV